MPISVGLLYLIAPKRSPGNVYFSDIYSLVKDTKNETYRSESGVTGEPGFGFHGLVRRSEPITGLVGFTTPHAFVPMVPAASIMSSHITVLSRWSLLLNITHIRENIYPIGVGLERPLSDKLLWYLIVFTLCSVIEIIFNLAGNKKLHFTSLTHEV